MKSFFKPLLVATLLATTGFTAIAASGHDCAGMMDHGGSKQHERMGKIDPAKMQARMDKHFEAMKAKLKITATQESAWTAYTAAMKPPVGMKTQYPDPAEMGKLTTPERIDKMQAMHTQRMNEMNAAMTQRNDATKALYAALNPEQKKILDENPMQRGGHQGGMHGKGQAPAPTQAK